MKIRTLYKALVFFGIIISFFLLSSVFNKVHAQSMVLSPSSATVNVGATSSTITITAVNPPATNTVSLRITAPSSILSFTNYTPPSGFIALGNNAACGTTSYFTASQICLDIADISGNISNGDSLGTFTFTGVSNGIGNINFITGNRYQGSADYTGTGGTYTIGSGGGSPVDGNPISAPGVLPSTGILDTNPLFTIGLLFLLIGFGVYIYNSEWYLNLKRTKSLENHFAKKIEG